MCFAASSVGDVNDAEPGGESAGRRGRPRANDPRRPGATAAEEILDAAAELFTTRGYAGTSTRAIADAVGIRQASLYHYFSTKDEILTALLEATVQAPLALARQLAEADGAPIDRLVRLAAFDAEQLASARFNLGALYHLPELAGDAFAEFRRDRAELAEHYRALSAAALGNEDDPRTLLPFRLVESVIGLRSDGALRVNASNTVTAICCAIRRALS